MVLCPGARGGVPAWYLLFLVSYCLMFLMKCVFFRPLCLGEPELCLVLQDETRHSPLWPEQAAREQPPGQYLGPEMHPVTSSRNSREQCWEVMRRLQGRQ